MGIYEKLFLMVFSERSLLLLWNRIQALATVHWHRNVIHLLRANPIVLFVLEIQRSVNKEEEDMVQFAIYFFNIFVKVLF